MTSDEEVQDFFDTVAEKLAPQIYEEWLNIIKYGEPFPNLTPEQKAREEAFGNAFASVMNGRDENPLGTIYERGKKLANKPPVRTVRDSCVCDV